MGAFRNGLKQTGKNIRNMNNTTRSKGKATGRKPRGSKRRGGSQGLGRL